jgi:hypothetical protein
MSSIKVITKCCIIRENMVIINNQLDYRGENNADFSDFIHSVYTRYQINYPKFFKMDNLSKLGFLTGELLLIGKDLKKYNSEEIGIVISNSSSSLDTDEKYYKTVKNSDDYFPSPSLFVYTLPNIMIGELCIKYKIQGENAFFVFENFEIDFICNYINSLMDSERIQSGIVGWVDLYNDKYESILCLIEKEKSEEQSKHLTCSADNIKKLYLNKNMNVK